MPVSCEVVKFYYGTDGLLDRLYAGTVMIWPCWNCSIVDSEFASPQYSDALMYVPKVCPPITPGFDFEITDAVSHIEMTRGDAYNGLFDYDDVTWGFEPPIDSSVYGETIVEAELPAVVDKVGVETSSVSFYLELFDDLTVDEEGLIIKVEDMEIELVASVFGGTQVLARIPGTPDPVEVQATTDLLLNNKMRVIVVYDKAVTPHKFTIYYNENVVGEVTI